MGKPLKRLLGAIILAAASPSLAGVSNFVLINGAGVDFAAMSIRRTGTIAWLPLPAAPRAGASASVAFDNPDCAFDLKAEIPGGTAQWDGVNLCGTSRLTLRRRGSGETWVDYD